MRQTIVREWRVASSRRAQPLWFRIIKWTIFLGVSAALLGSRRFWHWLLAASFASIMVHLIWRWKTQGWTRPWGGWTDLEAGRPRPGAIYRQSEKVLDEAVAASGAAMRWRQRPNKADWRTGKGPSDHAPLMVLCTG